MNPSRFELLSPSDALLNWSIFPNSEKSHCKVLTALILPGDDPGRVRNEFSFSVRGVKGCTQSSPPSQQGSLASKSRQKPHDHVHMPPQLINQTNPSSRCSTPSPKLEVPRSLLSSLWIRKDLLVSALSSICPVSASRKWPRNLYLPVLHRSWSSYIPDPGGPPCQDPIPSNSFSCHCLISHLHNTVPCALFPPPLPPSSPLQPTLLQTDPLKPKPDYVTTVLKTLQISYQIKTKWATTLHPGAWLPSKRQTSHMLVRLWRSWNLQTLPWM